MSQDSPEEPIGSALALALSRRGLVARFGAFAALAGLGPPAIADLAAAQGRTPPEAQVDQAQLQPLIDLSRTLCGGGTFDPSQTAVFLRLLTGDPDLRHGLDELLAAPPSATPAATPAVPSPQARAATQAILLFWYVGYFDGNPVPDRSTAYYRLTAWQAMYTPPFAVCKAFGGWADPPSTSPLVADG